MNLPNKQLINEWLEKASGDYEVAVGLYKSKRKKKIYYIIAFHCQQAIEKYLKALLICFGINFPKTHDLLNLLDFVIKKDQFLKAIEQQLLILNPFAVGFRYPGEDIDKEELKEAIKALKILKPILLKRIKEFL